jgi:hypothetical protein
MMPSDELHAARPFMFTDFEGISVHDALIVQKAVRARRDALIKVQGLKVNRDVLELGALDIALSLYIVEEVRKNEEVRSP